MFPNSTKWRGEGITGLHMLCDLLLYIESTYADKQQVKLFRRKRQSTGANFVHAYIETWDKGILKFNKFSM